MASDADDTRCDCCARLRTFCFSVCWECTVVALVFIDFLSITSELLIRLDVLREPRISASASDVTDNSTTYSRGCYPGGLASYKGICTLSAGPIETTQCLSHFLSVIIAAIFLVEVLVRSVSSRSRVWRSSVEVFDLIVVVILVTMEILFTVFWDKICHHSAVEAATYVVLLRLCRLPRALKNSNELYASDLEDEVSFWMESKNKTEEKNMHLKDRVVYQQREIEHLRKQLGEISPSYDAANGHVSHSHQNSGEFHEILLGVPHPSAMEGPDGTLVPPDSITRHVHTNGVVTGPSDPSLYPPPNRVSGSSDAYSRISDLVEKSIAMETGRGDNYQHTAKKFDDDVEHIYAKVNRGNRFAASCKAPSPRDPVMEALPVADNGQRKVPLRRTRSDSAISTDTKLVLTQLNDAIDRGSRGLENTAFEDEEEEEVKLRHSLQVMAEYEGTRTYRSAEGVPLTDL